MKSFKIKDIDPKSIIFDPSQPRKVDMSDEKTIESLEHQAETYSSQGIINMPEIRYVSIKGKKVPMCATGELRIRAAIIAGLVIIKVKVLIGYSKREIRERQLVENLHLHRLKPVEYEDSISKLWGSIFETSKNYKNKKEFANLLGITNTEINFALKAHEMREKYNEKLNTILLSTQSLWHLSTLPDRDQTRVVAQLQKGLISKDLTHYIPKLKDLTEDVKNATLRATNPISIKDAEFIENFKPEEKKEILNWLQVSKKDLQDEMEYKLKRSKGEITPQLIFEKDPMQSLLEQLRDTIIHLINTLNFPYLKGELTESQFEEAVSLVKRLLEHISSELSEVGISRKLKVITIDAQETN